MRIVARIRRIEMHTEFSWSWKTAIETRKQDYDGYWEKYYENGRHIELG
jgi:hypothetical protein